MDVATENTARKIVRKLFTGGFQLRPLPSQTSIVLGVDFTDGREGVVLKIPTNNEQEILREQRILDAMDSADIPVPQVLYTQENNPVDESVYTIMRRITGPSLHDVIHNDDQQTEAIFTKIGDLTARLAALDPTCIPDALHLQRTQADELNWWETHLDFITRHRLTTSPLDHIYHAARGIMLAPPTAFGHRDGVQVVTDGSNVFLVDVGSAGMNWPDADFARLLYAGVAWYDGAMQRVWREAVQEAYLQNRDLSDADVERILIFMIYYALRDAAQYAVSGKTSHVEDQYQIADYFLKSAREWFGR